jgi:hypothetical protein
MVAVEEVNLTSTLDSLRQIGGSQWVYRVKFHVQNETMFLRDYPPGTVSQRRGREQEVGSNP